jgi:hypothetical protein
MKLAASILATMAILFSGSLAAPMVSHGRIPWVHLAMLSRPL